MKEKAYAKAMEYKWKNDGK